MRPRTLALLAVTLILFATPVLAGQAQVELIPQLYITQPPNWSFPIIPHLSAGVTADTALAIPTLLPPLAATYFNYAEAYNPAVQGYWTDQMTLDGVTIQTVMHYNGTWAAGRQYSFNVGPEYLEGGRHVVTAACDIHHDVGEDPENWLDNTFSASFLWTPPDLAAGVVGRTLHAPPPQPGNAAFAITRSSGAGWMVALTMNGGDDYDLVLYDDFVNSTTGLSNERARSATVGDSVEIVVGAADATPSTLYPTVLRSSVYLGSAATVEWETADGRSGTGDQVWDSEALDYYEAAHIYELDLQAGVQYPMSVWRAVGHVPLAMAVFPPTPGAVFALSQAARSHQIPGQDYQSLLFTPAVSGKHLLVVYRSNFPGEIARYRLAVGPQAVSVASGANVRAETRILGVQPNPARDHLRIAFSTARAGPVRLTLHDVSGRRVATLSDAVFDAGRHDLDVPTRDDAGRSLAAGLYWARLEADRRVSSIRVAIIR